MLFFIGALFSVDPPLDVEVSAEMTPNDETRIDVTWGDQLGHAVEAFLQDRERAQALESRELVSFSLFWFVYSTFFLTVWGATPGKRLLGIRVMRSDGSALDWKVSLIRSLFSVVSGNFVMLGYLWGFFSEDRRAWHDRIAATRAVRAKD